MISKIIAGTMNWGVWGNNLDTQQIITRINTCLENQITTFDHADIYGNHTTEADFGKAFKKSNIKRENLQLISKCGIAMPCNNNHFTIKHYNYTANYIIAAAEMSLQNLQTDHLDILLLHRPSPLMQPDEIAKAIDKLSAEGKIKSFGVSNFTTAQSNLINSKIKINYNQIQFSPANLTPMLDGSLDTMQLQQITPMAWNPLGGIFNNNDEKSIRILATATKLAQKYNVTIDMLLLSWVMQHPANIHPVIGTTEIKRMINAQKATTLQLDLQDWFALWQASIGKNVP